MKIAAVTLTRNDDFRLVPWKMYFQDYKDELYEHIVVDNGSTPEYQRKLREAFPDSTHIELGYNGGCTGAYNAGIRHALQNPEIDTVMLIGNDIKSSEAVLPVFISFSIPILASVWWLPYYSKKTLTQSNFLVR